MGWEQHQPHPARCNSGTCLAAEYFAVPKPECGLGATAAAFGTLQQDKLVCHCTRCPVPAMCTKLCVCVEFLF